MTNSEDRLRRLQIQELADSINALNRRLNELIIEDQQANQEDNEEEQQDRSLQTSFQIGNRVVITNNYKGLRGRTGSIIRITRCQVTIRLDGDRRTVIKNKSNVLIIGDPNVRIIADL